MSKTIITSYTNPDLDGVACAVAYAELLGENFIPVTYGSPEKEVEYIFERFKFGLPVSDYQPQKDDKAILVDNSSLTRHPQEIDPNSVVEVIDHRPYPSPEAFPNSKSKIELVGAAATIIAQKYQHKNKLPSRKSAVLLSGGIISNTLNFQANITTAKDKEVFSWLGKIAKLPANFANEMFGAKSNFTKEELLDIVYEDTKTPSDRAGKMVCAAQVEMVGADRVRGEWKEDVLSLLTKMKSKTNTDIIFLSLVELDKGRNTFITPDKNSQKMLADIFKIKFADDLAVRKGLILRKEINPLVIDYIENIGQSR